MPETAANGHVARNAMLGVLAAAGLGWLLYSLFGRLVAIADGARDLGRTLRQRLDGAGGIAGGIVERVQNLTRGTPPQRMPKKVAVEEPMAGYGA